MARRKAAKSKSSRAAVVFWLAFTIIIICVFMANASTIQKNFGLFIAKLTGSPTAEEGEMPVINDEPAITVVIDQSPAQPKAPEPKPAETKPEPAKPEPPKTQTTQPQPKPQTPAATTTPAPAPVQTRDRAVYFTNVGSDGQILQTKVTRKIPVSNSPMQDSINTLLKGPSSVEVGKGIVNLIPQNTKLLSAAVRGNTAYVNFSEDFLFNTFGVEGYVAQLRQIVWTVTEFQNVKDVQILIEGRRLDYLGEGIWIGSPINRQSF
jgi:spore germination protein GerM